MSEAVNLSSNEIESWLKDKTSSILTPVTGQAKKLRDDMRDAILSVTDVTKTLLDNSAKEVERRNKRVYNRARAMNKLARLFSERIARVSIPDQVSYDTLDKFAKETKKVFIVTDIDIKNWFPRISPFFIRDRRKFLAVHEKAKESLTTLEDFLKEEYIKTKTLEETFQIIDELHTLENKLSALKAERAKIKKERFPIEKKMSEFEKRTAELQREGPVEQVFTLEEEKEKLNKELKQALRHLQKPFKKMRALALYRGGASLTQDELDQLNKYLQKPFEAFSNEDSSCPILKQILLKLQRLINEDKMKLKSDKKRKAKRAINEILENDSLGTISKRCTDVASKERQILNSPKMDETKRDLLRFQDQIKRLNARKARIEAHEAVKEQSYNELIRRIENHKKTIEENVHSSLGQTIEIL